MHLILNSLIVIWFELRSLCPDYSLPGLAYKKRWVKKFQI